MQEPSPSAADHGTGARGPQAEADARPPEKRRGGWRLWPRWLRIAIEATLGVVAGLVILGGIALWRLSSEPVRLDFLTPYLEQAIALEDRGVSVDVGETLLMWQGWPNNVDLRARKILVTDAEGGRLALLPDVSVTLSMRALLQGTVAPTFIEVIGPELAIERSAEGELSIGASMPDETKPDALQSPQTEPSGESAAEPPAAEPSMAARSAALRRLVDGLLIDPDPGQQLSFLSSIRIRDGLVSVTDDRLGQSFHASDLVLELHREAPGIGGELSLQLDLPGDPVRLEAAFTYDQDSGGIDLASSFADLKPTALPPDLPGAELVHSVALPLGGSLTMTLGAGGTLESATFDVTGAAGLLDLGDRLPEPRPVRALRLSGTYDGAGRRLVMQDASLNFGTAEAEGPGITGAGTLTILDDGLAVEGALRVLGLDADELPLYWPRGLDEGARSWITENIKTGRVDEANLEVALSLPDGGGEQVERFDGGFRYRDLDVHYLRPLPPVTGVSGTASFDSSAIRFQMEGGRSGNIELGASEAVIEGFDREGLETLSLKFPASGPLGEVLALLNHDRLRLIDKLGLDPASTRGQARSVVTFDFPLPEELSFDDVTVTTEGQAEGVAIKSLLLGQDATDGRLGIALNNDGMRVRGKMRLGGVPIDLDWSESFTDASPVQSHYEVLVPSMDDAERERFGFEVLDGLSGPVSASVVADARSDGTTTVQVATNLEQAALDLPEILWRKPVGQAGTASFTLLLRDNQLVELSKLEGASGSLTLKGSGRFDERGEDLASLALSELRFGGSALTDVLLLRQGLGIDVRIGGGALNAEPFLDNARAEDEASAAAAAEAASRQPPLRLRAENLDAVRFGEARYLERVSFDLERIGDEWNRIQLVSQVPRTMWRRNAQLASADAQSGVAGEVRKFSVDYRPVGQGRHSLAVQADDAGGTLRALDLLDTMEGGALRITGEALPGQPIQASLEVLDFTMIDAPVLGRLLLVASLTGIFEGLTSDGIGFDRMVGDFTLGGGRATTELIRAYGASLGLTAKGTLDYGRSELELDGAIVPVYGLNRILNEIPLIGTILTGGEGEGFVAFTYEMTGPLDEPRISVNPLSALAPGWLRGIFSGSGKGDGPTVYPEGNDR